MVGGAELVPFFEVFVYTFHYQNLPGSSTSLQYSQQIIFGASCGSSSFQLRF